jgi:hypothetical protein
LDIVFDVVLSGFAIDQTVDYQALGGDAGDYLLNLGHVKAKDIVGVPNQGLKLSQVKG